MYDNNIEYWQSRERGFQCLKKFSIIAIGHSLSCAFTKMSQSLHDAWFENPCFPWLSKPDLQTQLPPLPVLQKWLDHLCDVWPVMENNNMFSLDSNE